METNGGYFESWYTFIRYEPNRTKLEYLEKQINKIDMRVSNDMSAFDLDLEHLVSAQTAKEMTKVELNHVMFHRKFDGRLKTVHIGLKKGDDNETMLDRINNVLGMGDIDKYLSEQDVDEEDMVSDYETEEEDLITPLCSDTEEATEGDGEGPFEDVE